MNSYEHYDVVILGSGLAGLSLARQLLRETDKRILVLDKSPLIPRARQKYGESTVQVGGHYFAKILDMEEYLMHEHFMKYNVRFYFKTPGRDNTQFEDYSQAYIRNFSNIASYQLDRNRFEAELLKRNQKDPRFQLAHPVSELQVELSENNQHSVQYIHQGRRHLVSADWVVDATGRGRLLTRHQDMHEETPIRHGSSFMWVDGLINIEKLTDSTAKEIRLNPNRRHSGHTPHWLGTNHFAGEGFWFWVIPLRNMTSLGLVYDNEVIDGKQLTSAEALRDWVCEEFPLFARDLPRRKILDFNTFKSYSHSCSQTINASKWAITGEAGRFADPLYSPGSDLIAIHNTLITSAIQCGDRRKLARKCWLAELLMQSYYGSLMSTFVKSYDALGDHETFVLKYTWELSVYFTFFVFPFINELTDDEEFTPAFLSRFSKMGPLNHAVHEMISGYFQWKKAAGFVGDDPMFHELTMLEPLQKAEKTFYEFGLSAGDAKQVLDGQLENMEEFARFLIAYICSMVLDDERILHSRKFVEQICFKETVFNVDAMRRAWEACADCPEEICWSFGACALKPFRAVRPRTAEMETA